MRRSLKTAHVPIAALTVAVVCLGGCAGGGDAAPAASPSTSPSVSASPTQDAAAGTAQDEESPAPAAAVMPSATPEPAAAPAPSANPSATTTEAARLRSGASCDADILTTLAAGTVVEITGTIDGGWVPVAVGGVMGWVSAALLDGDGIGDVKPQCSAAPAAPAPAPAQPPTTSTKATAPDPVAPSDGWTQVDWRALDTYAGRIVEDVATADERFADRPDLGASTTMRFLSGTMQDLLDLGAPPGVDAARYLALVGTSKEFFERSYGYLTQYPPDITNAAAAYQVTRGHLPELLAMITAANGISYTLP